MARQPTPQDGNPITPFVSIPDFLLVQEAMLDATIATGHLIHPDDPDKASELIEQLTELADERRKAVNGNRHGDSLITMADLRLMTASWMRVLLESLEGVEEC